jgi:DNA-binding NarL/FixJ family response regulator
MHHTPSDTCCITGGLCPHKIAVTINGKFSIKQIEPCKCTNVDANVLASLTPRELTIVGFVAEAYSNKQIADTIGIVESVVKQQMKHVFDKVGVSTRLELAVFVFHHPILQAAAALSIQKPNRSLHA